jgi:hypothetical protein
VRDQAGGHCRSRSAQKKRPEKVFQFLNSFSFLIFQAGGIIIGRNTYGSQKNVKFCMEIDLHIFHNFCIGNIDQRSTIFKSKLDFRLELEFDRNLN